jgi:hypothetical protein
LKGGGKMSNNVDSIVEKIKEKKNFEATVKLSVGKLKNDLVKAFQSDEMLKKSVVDIQHEIGSCSFIITVDKRPIAIVSYEFVERKLKAISHKDYSRVTDELILNTIKEIVEEQLVIR